MVVANPRYRGLHQYTPLSKGEPSTSSNPEDFEEQHGDSCNLNEVFNKPHLASPGRLDGCKKHARVAQMSFATLQFSNPTYLEDEFQEEYAHSRATFDIVGSATKSSLFVAFLMKGQWSFTLFETLVLGILWIIADWLPLFVFIVSSFKARPISSRSRTRMLVVARWATTLLILIFGHRDLLTQLPNIRVHRVVFKLLFASKSIPLAASFLGRQLIWREHLHSGSLMMLAAIVTNVGSCRNSCSVVSEVAPAFETVVGGVNQVVRAMMAPALLVSGVPLSSLPIATEQVPRCWIAYSVLTTMFGFLIPSMVLYRLEYAARMRFLADRGYTLTITPFKALLIPAKSYLQLSYVNSPTTTNDQDVDINKPTKEARMVFSGALVSAVAFTLISTANYIR